METNPFSALLRQTRSAAKAVALPVIACKSLGLLAIAGSAALLIPGEAKALQIARYECFFQNAGNNTCALPDNPDAGYQSVQLGDKKLTFLSFDLSGGVGNEIVGATYSWSDTDGIADQDFTDDTWAFELSAPTGSPNYEGPFTFSYSYRIDIVDGLSSPQPPSTTACSTSLQPCATVTFSDPAAATFSAQSAPWYFNGFRLDTSGTIDPQLTTFSYKTVKNAANGDVILTSINGTPDPQFGFEPLTGLYKSLIVTDTVEVAAGGSIRSVVNEWNQKRVDQVPGPLPILGAGVAFGYSRRLRRRISKVASA